MRSLLAGELQESLNADPMESNQGGGRCQSKSGLLERQTGFNKRPWDGGLAADRKVVKLAAEESEELDEMRTEKVQRRCHSTSEGYYRCDKWRAP